MIESSIEVYFYQAKCGDAARVRYRDNKGGYHNILIDSGYNNTFKFILKNHIQEIEENNEVIDLWVITHIHDDHIGGVEMYIKQIKSGERRDIVQNWLFNLPREVSLNTSCELTSISSSVSIRQADLLSKYLVSNNKYHVKDVVANKYALDFFGLNIYILSPSSKKLLALRNKYGKGINLPLEKIEESSISSSVSSRMDDYDTKLMNFNLKNWKQDNSIENGSSISLLTEYDNIKILWLADSHPSDIIDSLRELGYSDENKINCDWVKVPHHGSRGNNSNELYDMIDCSNYLFSVNGENKFYLPAKKTIARILRNSKRDKSIHYTIAFTYDNNTLRRIFQIEDDNIYEELNFSVFYLKDAKFIKITI